MTRAAKSPQRVRTKVKRKSRVNAEIQAAYDRAFTVSRRRSTFAEVSVTPDVGVRLTHSFPRGVRVRVNNDKVDALADAAFDLTESITNENRYRDALAELCVRAVEFGIDVLVKSGKLTLGTDKVKS